jgi:hypothetical protein
VIETRTAIPLLRHGSQGFSFQWLGGDGLPLDITGYALSVAEASTGLEDHITVSIKDALTGEIIGGIVWAESIPDGLQSWFRLQLTKTGADPLAFPRLWVHVQ